MNDTPASQADAGVYVANDGEPLMPLKKARKELGISRSTAYRWRDQNILTFHKLDDGRVYCRSYQVFALKAKEAAGHALSR